MNLSSHYSLFFFTFWVPNNLFCLYLFPQPMFMEGMLHASFTKAKTVNKNFLPISYLHSLKGRGTVVKSLCKVSDSDFYSGVK